jgi:hypothetical protein
MRILVLAVLGCLMAAGCAAGTGVDAGPDVAQRSPLSGETSVSAPAPTDDPSLARTDGLGRSPRQAVEALIDAKNRHDWKTAFSLHATPAVDFDDAAREWSEADERYAAFVVHETRVSDEATAWVRVTFDCSTTPPGGARYPVTIGEPGEWWPLHKVDGAWRVRWLPRQ